MLDPVSIEVRLVITRSTRVTNLCEVFVDGLLDFNLACRLHLIFYGFLECFGETLHGHVYHLLPLSVPSIRNLAVVVRYNELVHIVEESVVLLNFDNEFNQSILFRLAHFQEQFRMFGKMLRGLIPEVFELLQRV